MISTKATHCRKHVIRTKEWIEKVASANRGKPCSEATRNAISKRMRGTGKINRICLTCKNSFKVKKPSSKVRFCSTNCGYQNRKGKNAPNWRSDMPYRNCNQCGKHYRLRAYTLQHTSKYCSYRCKAIYIRTHQPNKDTDIEMLMETALQNAQVTYVKQQPLCNVTVCDFYLPKTKTAIFCDGDYWHSLPGKAKRDVRQTKVLQNEGYTVLRFLGSEIHSSISACVTIIRHHLTSYT